MFGDLLGLTKKPKPPAELVRAACEAVMQLPLPAAQAQEGAPSIGKGSALHPSALELTKHFAAMKAILYGEPDQPADK